MLWFNYLSTILDPLAMDEAMEKAMLNCGLNVCDNDSMNMFEECPNNELLELLKIKKHARMFVHMLKYFENENHILYNSLCESNSLIKKHKRRNRISYDKVDHLKRKNGNDSQSSQGMTCYECNGYGHLKKECPNYLRWKGKVYATTFSDSDSSNSDSKESSYREGNYSVFMTIALVESSDDLSALAKDVGEHTELESIGIVEESNDEEDERTVGLQETYNSLLEKTDEYAKMAKAAIERMKRAEQDYRSLLVQYKEAKCEMEMLNGELIEAYSNIKFLEFEVFKQMLK